VECNLDWKDLVTVTVVIPVPVPIQASRENIFIVGALVGMRIAG
jgi:hypothetical protein